MYANSPRRLSSAVLQFGVDRIKLIDDLAHREPDAIVRTLAMMAYNPAIGRVLGTKRCFQIRRSDG